MKTLFVNKHIYIFLIAAFLSCKKQGNGVDYKHAKDNLFSDKPYTGKSWKLIKYEVNGIDSTLYIIKGNNYTNYQNEFIQFKQMHSDSKVDQLRAITINHFYQVEFVLDNKYLGFSFGGSHECANNYCERNIFNPEFTEPEKEQWIRRIWWKIDVLNKTDLTLTCNTSKSYKIILHVE